MWKGKLLLKQYIPLKRARFGMKMFSLCLGYLWNSYVYLGKDPDSVVTDMEMVRRLGKSGAVIPRLMEGLFGKGHNSMWTIGTPVRNIFPCFYLSLFHTSLTG